MRWQSLLQPLQSSFLNRIITVSISWNHKWRSGPTSHMSLQSQSELRFSKGHEPYVGAGPVKAAIAAVRSWVQPPCHDQKTLFLSALCSAVFPRSWGRGVLHMSHLESSNLQGLSSALWPVVSLYLSHYPLHKILLWWPKGILIFENRDVYLEGSWILRHSSSMVLIDSL